jgi:hypothetical protein
MSAVVRSAFRRRSTDSAIPAPLHTFADFIKADAA